MKNKFFSVMFILFILLSYCTMALCNSTTGTEIIPGDEWSWTRGAYNTFTGHLDLSDYIGRELTVYITSDLPYDPDNEMQSMPVFTSLNGKRIVMTKQSNTIRFTPESGKTEMEYAVSFRLPDKKRVRTALFTFRLTDEDGNELSILSGKIDNGTEGDRNNREPFYISADINMITMIITISAISVWMIVLIVYVRNKNRKIQEND